MTQVSYKLLVNDVPASEDLLRAVRQIEVEESAEMADMLRLQLAIAVRSDGGGWTLVDNGTFRRLTRLHLMVAVGNSPMESLIDAYVIETNVTFSDRPGQSTLNVVAMEPTVLMDLQEKAREWSDMADSDIAQAIFREYGFESDVDPTTIVRRQSERTVMQRSKDIQFLRELARRNNFECYVETDPRRHVNVGHFHRPRVDDRPQGVLSVNTGPETNVSSFSVRHDLLGPTTAKASAVDIETGTDPSSVIERPELAALGLESTVLSSLVEELLPGTPGPDWSRRVLLSQTGLTEAAEVQAHAQAVVDRSSWSITASGEVHTATFGRILRAKRPVLVRGLGPRFSGAYYVERVSHTISSGGYTQAFSLKRNALGASRRDDFSRVLQES